MSKYVAKQNAEGTFDLYTIDTAMGIDFRPVNVLVLGDTNQNVTDLKKQIADAQAVMDDLNAKLEAINALVPPSESTVAQ